MNTFTGCPNCGCKRFTVLESEAWDAEIFEDTPELLTCHNSSEGGIDKISCKNCDWSEDYPTYDNVEFA